MEKVERVKLNTTTAPIEVITQSERLGNYFFKEKAVDFIASGCVLLDNVMGGGYPVGRVVNIVGDKSTGKTLLAIEVCANFRQKFSEGKIYYHEAESAFDKPYAELLGLPVNSIEFVRDLEPGKLSEVELKELATVEGLFKKLDEIITEKSKKKSKIPALYIIDSLDALSDKAEQEREMGEGTYGANKAKAMSEMFRRMITKAGSVHLTIIFISQIRDKIGVMFGRKWDRSGGHALDFYASVVLYLAEVEKIKKTIRGVERVIGVWIKANAEKNKIGLPFRNCEFPILFGYGIDETAACLYWLKTVKGLEEIGFDSKMGDADIYSLANDLRAAKNMDMIKKIVDHSKNLWIEIEKEFLPVSTKY
jgi:recombination protein RecA